MKLFSVLVIPNSKLASPVHPNTKDLPLNLNDCMSLAKLNIINMSDERLAFFKKHPRFMLFKDVGLQSILIHNFQI
jgi:hypothetical protein